VQVVSHPVARRQRDLRSERRPMFTHEPLPTVAHAIYDHGRAYGMGNPARAVPQVRTRDRLGHPSSPDEWMGSSRNRHGGFGGGMPY
jgi:hypothetical protein